MPHAAPPIPDLPRPQVLAFLDDIKRHPDDDAPRLILADWLDDHGDAERAEFIRVSCARYRRLAHEDALYWALKRRERALLRRHGAAWKGPLRGRAEQLDFERGTLHLGAGDRLGEFLDAPWERLCRTEAAAWVTDLGVWNVSDDALVRLAACPVLGLISELYLPVGGEAEFRPRGAAALAACERAPYLTRLRVRYGRSLVAIEELLGGPLVGHLRTLELGNCGLGNRGARALAGCPRLAGLTDLDLWVNSLRAEEVRLLTHSPHLAGLTRLSLAHNAVGREGAKALAAAPAFGRLQGLGLAMCRIGNVGIEAMAAAPVLPPLRFLDLTGNCLTARGVEALVASPAADRLECLGLAGSRLGDKGARALAGSPRLRNLTRLDLTACGVGDDGARALAESPHLSRLEDLCVRWNEIGRAGKRALKARFGRAVRDLHRQAS